MRRFSIAIALLATLAAIAAAAPAAGADQLLEVETGGEGSGTVTSQPAGIDCGVSCAASFADATVVTLSGSAGGGSEAVVWEACPGSVNGANQCEVTMDAARKVRAAFRLAWRSEQPLGPQGRTYLGPIGDLECWEADRCLLITKGNAGMPAGLYAYDGSGWYLYSTVCGGANGRIAWVGPDEFWTVSDPQAGQQSTGTLPTDNSLCHFKDGAVVASYAEPSGLASSYLKMRGAACLGPAECWFGGERLGISSPNVGAFHLYWNGISLSSVPSLTEAEPAREDPKREVTDLAYHQGALYESVRVQATDEAPGEPAGDPFLVHRVLPGSPAGFAPQVPATTIDFGAATPEQLQGFRFSDEGAALWAVAGAADGSAEVTALRLVGESWVQVPLAAGVFQPGDPVLGLGAEPGAEAAWIGYRMSGEGPESLTAAHLALAHADGEVEPRIDLPAAGEGLGPRGQAGPIDCPAPGQCWLATSRGWLFHLGPDPGANDDPAMHQLITSRPADNSLPTLPPTALPEDDSGGTGGGSGEEPLPGVEAEPLPKHKPPLVSRLRQRLLDGRILELSFFLRARAHVQLLAKRKGQVVAKTQRYTMSKGSRSVRLRLDPKRWPTGLDFQVHPAPRKAKR